LNAPGLPSFSSGGIEIISKCFESGLAEYLPLVQNHATGISPYEIIEEGRYKWPWPSSPADHQLGWWECDGTEDVNPGLGPRLAYFQDLWDEYITEDGKEGVNALPRVIWADAICINQQDPQERAKQLRLMKRIYKGSTRLIIWLCEGTNDSEKAVRFISELSRRRKEDGDVAVLKWHKSIVPLPSFAAIWIAIGRMFARQWFRRAWIVQEYIVGVKGSVAFYCGKDRPSGSDLNVLHTLPMEWGLGMQRSYTAADSTISSTQNSKPGATFSNRKT
jgi:hypothetical protein